MSYLTDIEYKKSHMHEFDEEGIHKKTGTQYDENGYDREGYDNIGYNRKGVNRMGFGLDGKNKEPYYNFDVDERKDKRKEGISDYKKDKKYTQISYIPKPKFQNNTVYYTKELKRLRQEYRKVRDDKTISDGERGRTLHFLEIQGKDIKEKIKILIDR